MKIEKWGSIEFSPDGKEVTISEFSFDCEGATLDDAMNEAMRQIGARITAAADDVPDAEYSNSTLAPIFRQ